MVAETSEASKAKVLPVKTTRARARARVAKIAVSEKQHVHVHLQNLRFAILQISAEKATSQPEKCLAML